MKPLLIEYGKIKLVMKSKSNQKPTAERVALILISLYVLVVSLIMTDRASLFWPLSFFAILSLFSIYAVYKIHKSELNRPLRAIILIEAILATLVLWPKPLGYAADYIGIKCESLMGGVVKCSQSPIFSFVEVGVVLVIPMLLLALVFYARTKR